MKKYLNLIYLVSLIGCGRPVLVEMPAEIRPMYDAYFQVVPSHMKSSGSIVFVDQSNLLNSQVAGSCSVSSLPWKILISNLWWPLKDDFAKKMLIYQELTHCIFDDMVHSPEQENYMFFQWTPQQEGLNLDSEVRDYMIGHGID